jgi:hypothetical protein
MVQCSMSCLSLPLILEGISDGETASRSAVLTTCTALPEGRGAGTLPAIRTARFTQ